MFAQASLITDVWEIQTRTMDQKNYWLDHRNSLYDDNLGLPQNQKIKIHEFFLKPLTLVFCSLNPSGSYTILLNIHNSVSKSCQKCAQNPQNCILLHSSHAILFQLHRKKQKALPVTLNQINELNDREA